MFRLEDFITKEHLEACIKLTLLTSTLVFYAYAIEFFVAWYSGNPYEWAIFEKRAVGPYAFYFWVMTACNCFFPLIWWSKRMRNNVAVSLVVCVLINVGMWFERYNIIVSSLVEDFLPGSWGHYEPSWIEIGMARMGCPFAPLIVRADGFASKRNCNAVTSDSTGALSSCVDSATRSILPVGDCNRKSVSFQGFRSMPRSSRLWTAA